jgi:hypothetical protein
VARAAFSNGLFVGLNVAFAPINLLLAVAHAGAGRAGWAVVSFVVSVLTAYTAWRLWREHREGVARLPGNEVRAP